MFEGLKKGDKKGEHHHKKKESSRKVTDNAGVPVIVNILVPPRDHT